MISANIDRVRQKVAEACARAGRPTADVTLIAVTKTFPPESVQQAVNAGVTDVGENYVQELLHKREEVHGDVRWHFIGHLQSNKVKSLAGWVHMIHALDSESLAQEVNRRAEQAGRVMDVLVEVNTTGEGSKFGLEPERVGSFVRSLDGLEGIRIAGLMTIGPFLPDPEGSRPMFRRLRELRDGIAAAGQRNVNMQHLSMGMTGDFEVAIEEGATLIRVGTAIFGRRPKPT